MIDAPQLGDFVKARFEHDGGHRIGIVRQIIQRPGKTLVRLCSPQDPRGSMLLFREGERRRQGYDGNVTNWSIPMNGTMNASGANFTINYKVRVK